MARLLREMKAAIFSIFHKVGALFHKIGSLFPRIASLFRRVAPLFARVASLFRKVGSFLRNVVSLAGTLVRELRLLPPSRRIDRTLQKIWRGTASPPEYRFLPYVVSVLRVLGWVILIVGVLASFLFGLDIMNGGLMVGGTELRGVGIGVSAIVLGAVGSFVAWLFLLACRELVCLFIHVKENTADTAGSITGEPG